MSPRLRRRRMPRASKSRSTSPVLQNRGMRRSLTKKRRMRRMTKRRMRSLMKETRRRRRSLTKIPEPMGVMETDQRESYMGTTLIMLGVPMA